MSKFFHPYHLVSESPWPLFGSLSVMIMMMGMIKLFILYLNDLLMIGYLLVFMFMYFWWRDVVRESTFQGNHTFKVMYGLRMGMVLFILSEVMFFVSFFWTYFHMFLSPSVEIGSIWPPMGVEVFNPFNIPLLNTLILLSSGVSITLCHYMVLKGEYKVSVWSIFLTVFLGVIFLIFQYMEYNESFYSIMDSVYGCLFFMVTGFHGFHVLVGTLFILITSLRLYYKQFSLYHHFGFEAASWYWHFVDVVWLFLYIFVYWLSY